MKTEMLKSRWAILLLLLCMAGNTAHLLSHLHNNLRAFISSEVSLTSSDDSGQLQVSPNAEHTCVTCQSFQHGISLTRTVAILLNTPRPINVRQQVILLPVTLMLTKSHGERGPPLS